MLRQQPAVTADETVVKRTLLDGVQRETLLPALTAGLVIATLQILMAISYAALVFSGPLAGYLPAGFAILLVSMTVTVLVVALTGSLPGAISAVQDSSTALLSVMAASIAGAAALPAEATLATVLVAVALTTTLTGGALFVLGALRQGELIRFIPYPVTGGFLAGTGWLLTLGALQILAGPLSVETIPALFEPAALAGWLPGVLFGVVLLMALRRFDHFLVMPALIAGAVALFYLVLFATGTSLAEARASGWLLEALPGRAVWQPLGPATLARADWSLIVGQAVPVATIVLICAVQLLLNSRGIELALNEDVDLNRELRAAGLSNLLTGALGGFIGYQAVSFTSLSYRLSRGSRVVGLTSAVVCVAVLLLGTSMLAFVPKLLAGGVVLLLGLSFLVEWLVDTWSRLPLADYLIILLILGVIAAFGFLVGVGVGLAVAIALFVIRYSRVDIVTQAVPGSRYHSNVDRPAAVRHWLVEHGDGTLVLKLQGFIFFGTADRLLLRVKAAAARTSGPPLRLLLLDFQRVTGLDSSAVLSFQRMCQLTRKAGITLVLTSLPPNVREELERGGLRQYAGHLLYLPSLDHGIEWCEEHLLAQVDARPAEAPSTLRDQLVEAFSSPAHVDILLAYVQRRDVECGECLLRQGEPSAGMFFVESGTVTIQLEDDLAEPVRLRTMQSGTIVGEMGMYLGQPASASVIVEEEGAIGQLTPAALKQLEAEHPRVAADFHRYIARMLSHRLTDNNNMLRAVLE